ncbi:hypothetical protein B0T19DRAFT_261420 [Cercophora scortea]|uniref:Uncharacterized protein n=1 Tax=Cercophora scortea TaxID=314031 RepID=A0AAE0IBF6_9PEZI|nr:hypothetical protein B0T19DRAFT_261420 [Cercophora scortea]
MQPSPSGYEMDGNPLFGNAAFPRLSLTLSPWLFPACVSVCVCACPAVKRRYVPIRASRDVVWVCGCLAGAVRLETVFFFFSHTQELSHPPATEKRPGA